jgi:hypothetical protein
MAVLIQFDMQDKDGNAITVLEEEAHHFSYDVGKHGDMTVTLWAAIATGGSMLSVHNNVRSAWNVTLPPPAPLPPEPLPAEPTKAFDISSLPKKE